MELRGASIEQCANPDRDLAFADLANIDVSLLADAEDEDRRDKEEARYLSMQKYGKWRWCVKTKLEKAGGEIYALADRVTVVDGALLLHCDKPTGFSGVNVVFAPGQWTAAYAASCFDGAAIAVEHWTGEVER